MQNSAVPLFECRTKNVVIRVEPEYLSEQSNPYDSRFFWAYTVEIDNQGIEDLTVTERFLRYVQIDTQSDPDSTKFPSTDKQLNLAKLLVEELKE